ncbi:MAG TPA: hypothetical protein VG497_31125 [Kribbella sp.]|nr:hypothetical protein [Kribbella sp.]
MSINSANIAGTAMNTRKAAKAAGATNDRLAALVDLTAQSSEQRDQHLIALVNAQLEANRLQAETNRLLAAVLIRLGGQP